MPPQRPSWHGRALGAAFAKLADAMAPLHPEIPERCKTCAFRAGTIPNSMAGTLVEAMHCVVGIDPAPFGCHHSLKDGLPTKLCAGYVLAKLAPFKDVKAALISVSDELDRGAQPATD